MRRLAPRLLAAIASGALLSQISAPRNLHWLHWAAFLPLFWALRSGEHRRNAMLGYLAGVAANLTIFAWIVPTIVRFSDAPFAVGVVALLAFAGVFAVPYALVFGAAQWLRERVGTAWVAILPTLLVGVEQLTPALFPYCQGISQYRVPWIFQLASVTGVMGVSWLVVFVNAVLAEGLYRRLEERPQSRALYAAAAAALLATLAFGAHRTRRVEAALAAAPTLRVAVLQQGVTMEEREKAPPSDSLDAWLRLTAIVAPEHPDLVVWPESAVPYEPTRPEVSATLSATARDGGFDLFVGGGTTEGPEGARVEYNSAYFFRNDGALAGRYDKMILLPFGEHIPLSDSFPALKQMIDGPSDCRPGTEATIFRGDRYAFTSPICYEAILDAQMRLMARGDLFVNITNDGWFGDTAAPHQHAMLVAAQATMLGRPILRIAFTGVSFLVEPTGAILGETRPFTEVAEVRSLRLGKVDTLYLRGGWLFPWACVVLASAALVFAWQRGREAARRES